MSKALVKQLCETQSRSKGALLKKAADTIERLERELKEVSKERDDAVACLKTVVDRHAECVGCIHEDIENGCGKADCDARKNNQWKWRGAARSEKKA